MQFETLDLKQDELINTRLVRSEERKGLLQEIDPKTLAYLDFGLFKQLCKLGTSKDRICSVLSLSSNDYEYIARLE